VVEAHWPHDTERLMNLPDDTKRHAIIGATGSGKTQAALWHLSLRSIDTKPWIIYNWKDEKSIDEIPHARPIGIEEIPIRPGVYVVHPKPHETDGVENQMWEIWSRQNTGVYVDEGYMLGRDNRAFRALLTQGRSRQVPLIVLSQRPVWMDRFVFSEADFYQVFRLNNRRDRKAVMEFVPANLEKRLPDYHSHYYDVAANSVTVVKPVPDIQRIHSYFDSRLKRLKRVI
jgi:hypothetical protein